MNTTQQTLPLLNHPDNSGVSEVSWIPRHGEALRPTPLFPGDEVLGLNLMRGCAYQCGFCSARAYPGVDAGQQVAIYTDNVSQVIQEVDVKKPRAILICPSTDPFPPLMEVQQETVSIVEALANRGIQSWLMTRGVIRPNILTELIRHKETVKLTIGLTTLASKLLEQLEPGTASAQVRLEQIERCREAGLHVRVAMDPLVPTLTDRRENLEEVLEALASIGIHEVAAGYMFLRQGIAENLEASLGATGMAESVIQAFRQGPILTAPGLAAARYLPRGRRQRGYAMLKALAARHDIDVQINSVTNPDFASAKKTETSKTRPRLLSLFLKNETS